MPPASRSTESGYPTPRCGPRGVSPQHLSAWRRAARVGLLKSPTDVETPEGASTTTMRRVRSASSGQVRRALGGPGPRHELVETRGRPEIDQLGENIGQPGLGFDAAEFAGLDKRSDAGPILRALIMPREECIFAIENHGPFILPMSGRRWKCITAGIPISAGRCGSVRSTDGQTADTSEYKIQLGSWC
jgi:hypothetical protein